MTHLEEKVVRLKILLSLVVAEMQKGKQDDPIITHTNRGWREPGNSIRDPGIARTGIGFLVLLLYDNT